MNINRNSKLREAYHVLGPLQFFSCSIVSLTLYQC